MKNYTNYRRKPYYNPKRAVKTFQDLEIYQKALELSVFVVKSLSQKKSKKIDPALETKKKIIDSLHICALKIPHLLVESHSKRFGTGTECLDILDEAMLQCNKAVAYLEQARDICDTGVKWEDFDEKIKKYFYVRRKILNLQRVWKKYIQQNKEN